MDPKYNELLIRIDANLTNLLTNFNEHVQEDKKLKEKVEMHSKFLYGFLGVVAFMQFLVMIHK